MAIFGSSAAANKSQKAMMIADDDDDDNDDQESESDSYGYEDDEQEEGTPPPPFFDMSGVNGFFSFTSEMLNGGDSASNSSNSNNSHDHGFSSDTADDDDYQNNSAMFMMQTDGVMMSTKSTTDQSDARSTRSYDSASSHLKTLRRKGSKFNFNMKRTNSIRNSASKLKRRTVTSFKAMQRSMSSLSLSTSNTNNPKTLPSSSEGPVSSKRKGLMMSMASMRSLRPRKKKQKKIVETERHEHGDGGAIVIHYETAASFVGNGSSDDSTVTNNSRVSSTGCDANSGKTNNNRIQFRTASWNISSFRRGNSKKKAATENPCTDQTDESVKNNTDKVEDSEDNDEKYVFFPSIAYNSNINLSSKSPRINGAVSDDNDDDDDDDDLDFVDKPLVVRSSIQKKKSSKITDLVEDTSKNGGTTTESSTIDSDTSSSSSTSIDSSTIDDDVTDDVTDEASSSDEDDDEDGNDGLVEYIFGSPVRYFKKIRSSMKWKERPTNIIDNEVTIRTGRTSRPRTRSRSPAAFLRRRTIPVPKGKGITTAERGTRNGESRRRSTRGDGARGSRSRNGRSSGSRHLVSKQYDSVFRDLFLVDPIMTVSVVKQERTKMNDDDVIDLCMMKKNTHKV
eukprot:CAMPEP_0113488188 /NCGR_PEP_ID=MMETSP0014_2-20120614/25889_1 /TAXON_ID=2857 /ORGANISM="Nitzschia sp." /LENGTH=620 /DNA_ID=CAMNT_0000381895 /DNA_START=346 /DNA_END=2209 /DNA_ORIENTATION=- /assembly_acc=CAM_ASM_000159